LAAACALRGKTNTMKTKRLLSLCVLGVVLTIFINPAPAAEFYAIITNFGNSKPAARMDVSVDTTVSVAIDVLFDVYDANCTTLAEFTSRANASGLATSSALSTNDLFKLSNGQPAVVRARTPDGARAAAMLHQTGSGNSLDLAIFPLRATDLSLYAAGENFAIALGDVPSPTLLITNVSGADQAVDVFLGTYGAAGNGRYSTPRLVNNGLWRVDLTDLDKNANLFVTATGLIVVQLVLADGKRVSALTCMPAR
jgi:hypothetical protein